MIPISPFPVLFPAWVTSTKPEWVTLAKHRSPTAQRLRDALKPGGLLVIEGYAGGELGFKTDELRHDFADLKILRYEDLIDEADWSPGQKSRLVRLIAQKP